MPFSTTITYSSGGSFVYDSDLIEFASSTARLKSLVPTGSTFGALFTSSVNGNFGSGVLTGTATGSPTFVSSKLALTGGVANKYVDWTAVGNAVMTQTGSIKFKVTPNYSGTPAANQKFVSISNASGSTTNLILIGHGFDGAPMMQIKSSVDGFIATSGAYGVWNPTAGTEYEWELNFDITTGATRLFIDGTQFSSTVTGTGTRTSAATFFRVGAGTTIGTEYANYSIRDLILYNTVQHTTTYTPGYTLPATTYSTANPTIEVSTGFETDDLLSFTASSTVAGSDLVKYLFKVDGSAKYWNGSAWVASDGTYSQTNTAAEINTNAAALVAAGATLKLVAYLHSEDGTTFPILTSATAGYDFFVSEPSAPSECIVYLWVKDILGDVIGSNRSAKLKVINATPQWSGNFLVAPFTKTVSVDADGYAELGAIQAINSTFYLTYNEAGVLKTITFTEVAVPASTSAALSSFATVSGIA